MKMYHWGFDLSGYAHPASAMEFLRRNGFAQIFHGYDPFRKDRAGSPVEHGFVYLNPEGVILVTERQSEINGDMGYVGLSSFDGEVLLSVVDDLKDKPAKGYLFVYKDESPGKRDFI